MPSPIFLDANVPIYAAGTPHSMKEPCIQILVLVAQRPQAFVTSAEVLQDLLHYYVSRGRWTQGREVIQRFAALLDRRIESVHAVDIQQAVALADSSTRLDARDLLHAAVMARLGCDTIISADRGFDAMASITRLDPLTFATWRATIAADSDESPTDA